LGYTEGNTNLLSLKSPGTSKYARMFATLIPATLPVRWMPSHPFLLTALPLIQTQDDSDSDSETKPW
jgi:hypothetical protein